MRHRLCGTGNPYRELELSFCIGLVVTPGRGYQPLAIPHSDFPCAHRRADGDSLRAYF